MDIKIFIEIGLLLLAVSAIYWRVHYKTVELSSNSKNFEDAIKYLRGKDTEHDKAIADLRSDLEKTQNDFEKRMEKRLIRIEKILIKLDERIQLKLAEELMKDD